MQICFFGAFTRNLSNPRDSLTFFFRFLNLLKQHICYIGMFMQVIIYILLYKVTDKLIDTDS